MATGANRNLGLDDKLFVLADSVLVTGLGRIALMPCLVLAARVCPEVTHPLCLLCQPTCPLPVLFEWLSAQLNTRTSVATVCSTCRRHVTVPQTAMNDAVMGKIVAV